MNWKRIENWKDNHSISADDDSWKLDHLIPIGETYHRGDVCRFFVDSGGVKETFCAIITGFTSENFLVKRLYEEDSVPSRDRIMFMGPYGENHIMFVDPQIIEVSFDEDIGWNYGDYLEMDREETGS